MIYRLSSFLVKVIKQNPSNQKWPQQRTSKRSTKTAQTLITGNHVVRSTHVKMSKSRLFICKLIFVPRRLKKGRIVPLYSNSPFFSAHPKRERKSKAYSSGPTKTTFQSKHEVQTQRHLCFLRPLRNFFNLLLSF